MEWISVIIEILACVISFIICAAVVNTQFQKRAVLTWKSCFLWGLLYVGITYLEIGSNIISSVLGMLLCLFFAQIYFEGAFIRKLVSILLVNVSTMMIGLVCIQMISAISGVSIETLTQYGTPLRTIEVCIVKTICIWVTYIALGILHEKEEWKREELIIGLVFSISFFFVALFFMAFMTEIELAPVMQVSFVCVILILAGINVLTIFLLRHLHLRNRELLEYRILQTKLEEQERFIKMTEENNRKLRKFRHDMRRYFTNYLQLLEDGQIEFVKKDMQKTFDTTLSVKNVVYTSNSLLNVVINEKKNICATNKIPFTIQVQLPQGIDSMELAICLSNVLDNAVEAEQKEGRKGMALYMDVVDDMLNLLVENRISHSVIEKNPMLRTSKKNHEEHGVGMQIIREIVERFHGFFIMQEEQDKMIVHIIIPVANLATNR